MRIMEQLLEKPAQRRTMLGIGERELHECAKVRLEITDVESALGVSELDRKHAAAVSHQRPDGIGELNLTADAGARLLERVEDRRREHISRRDCEIARRAA